MVLFFLLKVVYSRSFYPALAIEAFVIWPALCEKFHVGDIVLIWKTLKTPLRRMRDTSPEGSHSSLGRPAVENRNEMVSHGIDDGYTSDCLLVRAL